MKNKDWKDAQSWEKDWHGNCVNSIGEELKQLVYARKMGIEITRNAYTPYNIEMPGKSVLDIGGGAYSLLLKVNAETKVVIDPLMEDFPFWVAARYDGAGIDHRALKGETFKIDKIFDEVWIYNVLQHTENPEEVIKNAKAHGKLIRIFEWIDTPTNIGHIHTLTEENLNSWLGGSGKVEQLNENGCVGKAYYGVF
jgi:2-polyprenyl-3-methyl-5-hydroxy-6-metoxy-1,4-benzoquinol methylase